MRQLLAPRDLHTTPVLFPQTFALSKRLGLNMIWAELVVSRRSCCVATFDGPHSGAAKYQAELALVDAGDEPCALVVQRAVANTAVPVHPDGRSEDLALATILIDSIPAMVFAAEPAERGIKVHLDDSALAARR